MSDRDRDEPATTPAEAGLDPATQPAFDPPPDPEKVAAELRAYWRGLPGIRWLARLLERGESAGGNLGG